jgi:ComF family protein
MGLFSAAVAALSNRIRLEPVAQCCVLCDAEDRAAVCASCADGLTRVDAHNACPQCAQPSLGANLCGQCIRESPAFDATHAALVYAFPTDRLVQAFKFSANLSLVEFLASEMVATVSAGRSERGSTLPDGLVALPLARARLASRGFNQASLLAKTIGARLGVPVAHQAMLRIRETPPQAGLDRDARRKNVRGAFEARANLTGKHVAIIDDVMTTGATLAEAAKALKRAGAVRVEAWVLARATFGGHS